MGKGPGAAHDQRQLFFPFNDNYYSRRGTIIGLAIGQRWRVLPQEKILPWEDRCLTANPTVPGTKFYQWEPKNTPPLSFLLNCSLPVRRIGQRWRATWAPTPAAIRLGRASRSALLLSCPAGGL